MSMPIKTAKFHVTVDMPGTNLPAASFVPSKFYDRVPVEAHLVTLEGHAYVRLTRGEHVTFVPMENVASWSPAEGEANDAPQRAATGARVAKGAKR